MIKKVNVKTIQKFKDNKEKFSVLTAYDYSTAKYLDEAGIDIILIGDSLAMVALGYETTHAIGVNEMSIFTGAVARGVKRAMDVTDMPFLSYHTDISSAVKNCGEMIKLGANAVKIEGFSDYIIGVIKRLVETGIPVMGHLGFTPQFLNTLGGYKIQGKTQEAADEILRQAQQLEKAGVFSIVLEMVPDTPLLLGELFTQGLCDLAIKFFEGRDVVQNKAKAVEIWRLAAALNNKAAMDKLAWCAEHGEGTKQDKQEAAMWRQRITGTNTTEATQVQSRAHEDEANKKDKEVELLEERAKPKNGEAMWMLGVRCEFGMGVKQDVKRAEELFKRSAEQGNQQGQLLATTLKNKNGRGFREMDLKCLNSEDDTKWKAPTT